LVYSSKAFAVITASVIVFTSLFALPSQAADDKSDFYRTLSSINKESKKNPRGNTATISFSPSLKKKEKREYKAAADRTLSFWSRDTNLGNVSILFWSPSDFSWAKKKYAELTLGWNYDYEKLENDYAVINGKPTCRRSSASVRYTKPFSSEPDVNHIVKICVNDTKTPWWWHEIAHEITHVWQHSAVRENSRSPLWLWIMEGGATYYGLALTGIDRPNGQLVIKNVYSSYFLTNGKSALRNINRDSAALVKLLDSTLPSASFSESTLLASYYIGSLVVAKMVEEFGHKKFAEFYKSLSTSDDYKESFKAIYGIDFGLFCEEIAEDIFNQVK